MRLSFWSRIALSAIATVLAPVAGMNSRLYAGPQSPTTVGQVISRTGQCPNLTLTLANGTRVRTNSSTMFRVACDQLRSGMLLEITGSRQTGTVTALRVSESGKQAIPNRPAPSSASVVRPPANQASSPQANGRNVGPIPSPDRPAPSSAPVVRLPANQPSPLQAKAAMGSPIPSLGRSAPSSAVVPPPANHPSPPRPEVRKGSPISSAVVRPSPLALPAPCASARDAGFRISLRGTTYSVKRREGSTEPILTFVAPDGTQVRDGKLTEDLAGAAWTIEHVVRDPQVRTGAARVTAIMQTSAALDRYTIVQDAIVRANVALFKAGLSGGSGAAVDALNLTRGMLVSAGTDLTKWMALSARRGLRESADAYARLQPLLPPPNAPAFSADSFDKIRENYETARRLELWAAPLAVALMRENSSPGKAALTSAAEEIVGFASPANEKLTAAVLLKVNQIAAQALAARTGQDAAAGLRLAIELSDAESRQRARWTASAASSCSPRVP